MTHAHSLTPSPCNTIEVCSFPNITPGEMMMWMSKPIYGHKLPGKKNLTNLKERKRESSHDRERRHSMSPVKVAAWVEGL
jgi:hypothetical protein